MDVMRRLCVVTILLALISGCGGGGGSGGSQNPGGGSPPAPLSPTTPVVTITHAIGRPGDAIAMSATSTDPQNTALTYSWNFGDGTTGTGSSVTHMYTTEGQFNPRVTVTNQAGLSASATAGSAVVIAYLPVQNFQIFDTNTAHFLGQTLVVETAAVPTDVNNLPITYLWSFGDNSTATGPKATHVYAAPGTYTVTLTVTNSANRSSTTQTTAQVFAPTAQPAPTDNLFAPYCSGPLCGASSASNYSGTGVGIWRYRNSTASSATLDIEIQGVHGGQSASLVFTNGTTADAANVPGAGTLMQAPSSMAPLNQRDRQRASAAAVAAVAAESAAAHSDAAHAVMLERNLESARDFIRTRKPAASAAPSPSRIRPLAVNSPPALGTTRVWTEKFSGPTPYNMEVAATCELPSGRNAVFWIDSAQVASGAISPTRIQFMVTGFCGTDGAYARQIALTGDVWGPAAASSGFIEDVPGALQDLHIVMPGVPANTGWGGYFSSGNLSPAVNGGTSNGSLAVFINANLLTRSATDVIAGATLVHELKHHINFYQRTVARGAFHPPWLEETSAMLSEDLFTLPFIGYNRAELRHSGYVFSGGGTGYIGWTQPDGNSYNQGGSFGAFLHRRYGLDVDRRLIDTCADVGTPVSAYQCLDSLIVQWGGHGFDDEFSRLGASVFGGLGKGGFPAGFGFPSVQKESVFLEPFSSASVTFPPAKITPRPIAEFLATMHTYQLDFVGTGQTVYKRQGVVVPPGTTLMLVIQ